MELLQPDTRPHTAAPPLTARYCAVLWEPLPGTGERVVAMVAVQAHESTEQAIAPGTYPVLSAARLRQMLGRQRAASAAGILRECADFMTQRQRAGLPLDQLKPLFRGFHVGPALVARAYSVDQLLDAAVRSVSAFGSADEMIEEEETRSPRHMVRTAEFLQQLRRIFTAEDRDHARRFDVPLSGRDGAPDVTVDYADGTLAVQVTSLPSTKRQAEHAEREGQSKLLELDIARSQMAGNAFRPTLLFNTDALADTASAEAQRFAQAALARMLSVARYKDVAVLQAESPGIAARLLDRHR